MKLRVFSMACVLLAPLLAGCSSGRGGSVSFAPMDQNQIVTQKFQQAYISRTGAGECDIVLLDSAANWDYRKPKKRKGPLQPAPLEPMQQVMHIHLYWKPLAGTTKNPAAINASINWYVMGAEGSNDMLVYEGAGFVSVNGSGENQTIIIRDGQIRPKAQQGQMVDPIGPARIAGKVTARLSDLRVRDTIAQMQQHLQPQAGAGE